MIFALHVQQTPPLQAKGKSAPASCAASRIFTPDESKCKSISSPSTIILMSKEKSN